MRTLLLLALLACSKDDDGFDRSYGGGGDDDTAQDTGAPDDSGPPDSGETGDRPNPYDPAGGGDDTFDATWSRCEELGNNGVRWTFHAELRYAASEVQVELDQGAEGYELWYLEPTDGAGLVWEVAVENLSNRTCDEWIELLWTASGGVEWSTTYESLYTPP